VQNELRLDVYSWLTVVFRSKRGDRIKILVWDGSGLVMGYNGSMRAGSLGRALGTARCICRAASLKRYSKGWIGSG
jgi:hypothetical protein